ncbi:sulfotransferase family 2 domain-containing protein [Paraglaciecola hydrolytica]|uniref:Sulfotransferase n=1 Tax=Paraglaciecola hydrolytica TaxID=1799789 RepID=A0A136A6R6_9ALTE|nr:sulfotransferase family 2 domain-containing protein [Paraglaciecola hydrolytica]KXI30820.1 sulfotransferase [Paraglaciecola hydrolytica]
MLLSHRYNFLYIHIAKTGGTSMRAALNKLRWTDPMYYLMFPCHKISQLSGHKTASKLPRHAGVIAAKEMLPAAVFDNLFKFAFVRNPWDLQVSSYHHIQKEAPHLLSGINNFSEFIHYKLDANRPAIFHFDISTKRQTDHLVDLDGKIVVDFIGRYENLSEDFIQVQQRLNLKQLTMPHKRKAPKRDADYRQYYSDETAEKVARYFAKDIRLLNYAFE